MWTTFPIANICLLLFVFFVDESWVFSEFDDIGHSGRIFILKNYSQHILNVALRSSITNDIGASVKR